MTLPANALFRRNWKVVVGNVDVSALDLEFKILRNIKKEPNKCTVTIWNLSTENRGALLKANQPAGATGKLSGVRAYVEAGYVGNTSILFDGDLREVASVRDGTDWKTTLAGDDGGRAFREARINLSLAKGTPIGTVLQHCTDAMSVGIGNAADFTRQAEIAGIGATLPHAMTLSGAAADQLDRVVRSIGLTWSVQNGALQLLRKNEPLNMAALLISPSTGLIGAPEASIDATVSLGSPLQFSLKAKAKKPKKPKTKDPSVIKFKTLLIPGLLPGRKIDMQSLEFKGGYVLTEVEYVGQSWGNDWQCACCARIY